MRINPTIQMRIAIVVFDEVSILRFVLGAFVPFIDFEWWLKYAMHDADISLKEPILICLISSYYS